MSNQHGPRFSKETLQCQQHQIHLVRKLHHYQRKCHVQRRQMTLAIIIIRTIESISQPRLACRCLHTQPSITRDTSRYSRSKPKGETLHSSYLHTKFRQYDNNFRVPACLRVQCTFSASVPVFTTTSVPSFTKTHCNNLSNKSHSWPACDTNQLCKFQFKQKHEHKLTIKGFCFISSFIKQFPLPTQSRPSPMTHYMFHSSTFTTAAQNHECYLMHLRTQNQHSQTGKHSQTMFILTHNPLSTNNINTKFYRAFSAMTATTFLSLSQHFRA